jgi:hypothetical protein
MRKLAGVSIIDVTDRSPDDVAAQALAWWRGVSGASGGGV